ncbi:MAG: hypothetical protein G5Z42_07730 [Caldisphaeraceae archaeon]|nr:hypothetical protein [Caldisphaeraceae archaeon]MEB3691464.1 hypothetical protein [Caldisphaeraceae archaeon]MEB3798682.1 hypothetical protein [Caldisphaeraceae archaeon]
MSDDRKCKSCYYWRPHVLYPYIGLCVKHGKITTEDDTCEYFTEIKVDKNTFYWIPEIRTRVYGEEANVFINKGYKVYVGAYVDPDVRDEIYGAF